MGSAPLLSHLTHRQIIILSSLSFKPTFCALLCEARSLDCKSHPSCRLMSVMSTSGKCQRWTGGRKRRVGTPCLGCVQCPVFSLFRHFRNQPHPAFPEIPPPARSEVRALTPCGSSKFLTGLWGSDNSACSFTYPAPRADAPSCNYHISVTSIQTFFWIHSALQCQGKQFSLIGSSWWNIQFNFSFLNLLIKD